MYISQSRTSLSDPTEEDLINSFKALPVYEQKSITDRLEHHQLLGYDLCLIPPVSTLIVASVEMTPSNFPVAHASPGIFKPSEDELVPHN